MFINVVIILLCFRKLTCISWLCKWDRVMLLLLTVPETVFFLENVKNFKSQSCKFTKRLYLGKVKLNAGLIGDTYSNFCALQQNKKRQRSPNKSILFQICEIISGSLTNLVSRKQKSGCKYSS